MCKMMNEILVNFYESEEILNNNYESKIQKKKKYFFFSHSITELARLFTRRVV